MSNVKKILLLVLFITVSIFSSAENLYAITGITSDLVPTMYSTDGLNTPILKVKESEIFDLHFAAANPVGEIKWSILITLTDSTNKATNLELWENNQTYVDPFDTNTREIIGNTINFGGSLGGGDKALSIGIMAFDYSAGDENTFIQYNFWVVNESLWEYDNGTSNGSGNNNNTGETGDQTQQETERLHVSIVEPIPEEYKTDDLLQKLADNASISRSEIQWLSADVINTAEPPEPTTKMREQVKSDGYEFVAKLNTIKVSEDGYYAFMVTVSDDLVGTKVSDLKLYYAEPSDFLSSVNGSVETAFGLMPLINGVTGGLEVSNFLGVKLDTLPKQFLATMFLSASKSMTVYIVKILLVLLGGCNVGFGIAGTFVVGVVAVKFFKTRK